MKCMDSPDVTAIIVSYNTAELLHEAIGRLYGNTAQKTIMIVMMTAITMVDTFTD